MGSPPGFEGMTQPEAPTSKRPEAVRVWLFGGFRVSVGSRTITQDAWRLRKVAALVKLLALAPGHRLHREQVMDLLWPNSARKAASNSLRKALHAARRTLDPDAGSRFLASEEVSLVLCPEGKLWVDAEVFEETAATARRSRDPAAYRAAIELYAGELLPEDRYEEWADGRREELRRTLLSLHVELARMYEERGDYRPAIESLHRAVAKEPTLEEAHVGLMRLHALHRQRGEALTQYERLREALRRELDTEPSASVRSLREKIAAGSFPPPERSSAGAQREGPQDAGKHNLPAARTSFVGREREIVEIKRALTMTRLLTLTGAGGSGKTRLALEIARDLVGAYPEGVWLVELAPLSDEGLVLQAVAGALGILEQSGQPLADALIETLRPKTMLLVLDNCEHLVDAVASLATSLLDSCPRLRIMATSREVLRIDGEAIWPVSLLSVPDSRRPLTVEELEDYEAVRLFVARARDRNPTFALRPKNAQAVAEICTRLEGIPLAIELAAARVKMLSPQALLARLNNRLKLLTGGARNLPERQRTLRSAIEWSYELLEEAEKTLFRRLEVFSGGSTLETIEAVCNAERDLPINVLDGVSSLLDKSLLRQEGFEGEPRYVMLETIHEFANERLEASSEAVELRRLHAEYFTALAEQAEPGLREAEQESWLERLDLEHDNIRAALSWAISHEEVEIALRLGGALQGFWYTRGHFGEGRGWLEQALTKDERSSKAVRIKALEGLSWLANEQGDLDRAEAIADEGLELSIEAGIEGNVAASLRLILGEVAEVRGDHRRAQELLEESWRLYWESGDRRGVAWALSGLGNLHYYLEDYEQAMQFYEEGLTLSRELGGAQPHGDFLISLGYESLLRGDYERAAALNEEAAVMFRQHGRKGGLEFALDNLGWAALLSGDHQRAKALHEESLALCRELGDKYVASESLEGLACIAVTNGEAERAATLFGAAEALREAVGYHQVPRERALREPYLASASSQLGEAAWEQALAEGREMSLENAVEYTFSREDPDPLPATVTEVPSGDEPPTSLTHRQEQIAALVAQGLTNRQIASELSISEHTVATHVARILKKLGLHSRAKLASWITEMNVDQGSKSG